ncbi:MAG TPA: type II secretion system protein [Tepidisphaeraceae bacterium]|jgi:general secretion pathway protein G|nr:type II secretion system protein [Tepidisphaeraceae bacterium]
MSNQRANRRRGFTLRGFTLVEILIVVIILGILAAIVIPQFTNASQNARESSLQSTLQTLRSQIQLFKLQHGDTLPNLITDWTPLTADTTYGNPSQTFGPYMQAIPINSMNGNSNVVDSPVTVSGATAPTVGTACGFVYDYNSGNGSGLIYGTDNSGSTPGTVVAGQVLNGTFSPY